MFCREQVAGFRSRNAELKALGVKLVFIGSGTPAMAADFREFMQLDVPVWTDPRRQTYAHLGFKRGVGSVASAEVLRAGLRAMSAGFRQGRTQGDAMQQGGVLVVKRGGEPVYAFASTTAGHHPPLDLVLEQAKVAASA